MIPDRAHRRWESLPDTIRAAAMTDPDLGAIVRLYMTNRLTRSQCLERLFIHHYHKTHPPAETPTRARAKDQCPSVLISG
jgi:hypothetical protein